MALVGLKTTYMFLVDPKTHKILTGDAGLSASGIFEVDNYQKGSTQANITGLEGSITKVAGNNVVQDVYTEPASPSVAWTINDLDIEVRNKIIGYVKKGNGWVKSPIKPHLGLVIDSQNWDKTNDIFYAFPEGVIQMAGQNVVSDTDSKKSVEPDALTFNALYSHTIGDDHAIYLSTDQGFSMDAMFADIADGYKPASAPVAPPANGK